MIKNLQLLLTAKHQASPTAQAIASLDDDDDDAESSSNKASWVALPNLPPVSVLFGLRASLRMHADILGFLPAYCCA